MTLRWQLTWYVSSVLEECSIDVNLALKVAWKEGPFHFFDTPPYIAIPSSNRGSILYASSYMTPQISILVSLALKMSRLRSKINCLPTLLSWVSAIRSGIIIRWEKLGMTQPSSNPTSFWLRCFRFKGYMGPGVLLHSCNCMGGERVTAKWRGLITCMNKARKAV
jgi:hypothetical protein